MRRAAPDSKSKRTKHRVKRAKAKPAVSSEQAACAGESGGGGDVAAGTAASAPGVPPRASSLQPEQGGATHGQSRGKAKASAGKAKAAKAAADAGAADAGGASGIDPAAAARLEARRARTLSQYTRGCIDRLNAISPQAYKGEAQRLLVRAQRASEQLAFFTASGRRHAPTLMLLADVLFAIERLLFDVGASYWSLPRDRFSDVHGQLDQVLIALATRAQAVARATSGAKPTTGDSASVR